MSAHAIFWWIFAVALIVVLAMIASQALRAVRELKRFSSRLEALDDLPILKRLAGAEDDVRRIEAAAAQAAPLAARAEAAIAVIRRGPLPPELGRAIARVGAELAAFRGAFDRR